MASRGGQLLHHVQRHGAIEWGRLVWLAIFPQQLHVHRIARAKRIIELTGGGAVADGLDTPELGQVHLVGQLRELSFHLAPLRPFHRFTWCRGGEGHLVTLEAYPLHPLAVDDGAWA